ALRGLEMGHVTRITLRFRREWWPEHLQSALPQGGRTEPKKTSTLSFLYSRDERIPVWWTTQPARAPVLVGWAGGPQAERLLSLGDDAIAVQAVAALAHVFHTERSEVEREVEAAYTYDWQADAFARGS